MGIVGLEHLADDIVEIYKKGIDSISEQVKDAAKLRAEECKERIQQDSPVDSSEHARNSGEYAKGWKVRKTKDGYEVVNKNKPNIEMPLEHGHLITRGPNKGKRTKAIPHIYDNADKSRDDYINDCLKIVRKGGDK